MGGAVDFVGGLAEGAAEGQRHAVQKQYNQAMLKKFKADLDLQEKKQAYIAAHPELEGVAYGLASPESSDPVAKAVAAMLQSQPQQSQPSGLKFGPSFAPTSGGGTGTGYQDMLVQAMQEQGVASSELPYLMAMMQTESAFKPGAVSPKGATGLMQLMPGTAREMGVTDIRDPQQNISGGVRYYNQMLNRFGGDRDKAIQAYNAGPGAVEKYGGTVPYAETRDYLQKVQARASQYGAGPPSLQLAQGQPMPKQGGRMQIDPNLLVEGYLEKKYGYPKKEIQWQTEMGEDGNPWRVGRDKRTGQPIPGLAVPEAQSWDLVEVAGPDRQPTKVWINKNTLQMVPAGVRAPSKMKLERVTGAEGDERLVPFDEYTGMPAGAAAPGQGQAEPGTQVSPKKATATESAGKIQLAQTGLGAFEEMKNLVFDEKGKVNKKNLLNAWTGTPLSEGRNLSILAENAADAITRAATGAGMPQQEMEAYKRRYVPSVFDNEETIRTKMAQLSSFLNGYLEKLDPTGATRARVGSPESFKKKAIPKTADDYMKKWGQ